ncbi:MAG TPA: FHA domain-containing protein [Planctomycetota bacterium]|nr:FHA domain-containing protein [Planctomycetota bacterium]
MSPMKMEITSGGRRFTYGSRSGLLFIRVGSGPDNDIVLDGDAAVSSLHAKIECFMGQWRVTDQMSDSGTRLNGEAVYSADLKASDVLQMGGSTLRIVSLTDTMPPSTAPTPKAAPKAAAPASLPPSPADRPVQPPSLPRPFVPQAQPVAASSRPAGKKGNPWGGLITLGFIGLVVLLVCLPVIIEELSSSTPDEIWVTDEAPEIPVGPETVRPEPGAPRAKPSATSKRLTSQEEQAVRARLRTLTDRSNKESWESRLEALDALVKELEGRDHALGYLLESTRLSLANSLAIELSRRSNQDQSDIFDLASQENFREAIARLTSLKAFLEENPYRLALADRAGLKDYLERTPGDLAARNEAFIGRQFLAVDGALALDDFKKAAPALEKLARDAHIDEEIRNLMQLELQSILKLQEKQTAGEWPPARAPFNKRKWKLPAAPKSSLLPDGDSSQYRFINPLRDKLVKAARAGEMKGAQTLVYGCEAILESGDGWRVTLKVSRALKREDGSLKLYAYTLTEQPSNLPAATVVRLYEQIPNASRAEFLGALCYCFDNGLMEDAPRLALKLWKSDESVKADLDALLAAKLSIEVPEGGFVERDGRLVPP